MAFAVESGLFYRRAWQRSGSGTPERTTAEPV